MKVQWQVNVDRPERLELIEGAAAAIACFNRAEYRTIVVTNQPVVARGNCSMRDLQMIHNKMETELGDAELSLMPSISARTIQIAAL